MKKLLSLLALCGAVVALPPAGAHGAATPNHGGVVQAVGETWLELVVRGDTIELYLEDDGEPMPSAGLTGQLTILAGSTKSDAILKPAEGNKMEAKGSAPKGAKVLAKVTLADKKTKVAATFTVK